MNEPQKHRQSIRLKGYDYRLNGAYYITICSYQKQYLFGEIVEGNIERNLLGDTVEAVWYRLPLHFKFIELDTFIVMPNHIHGIIVIQNYDLEKSGKDRIRFSIYSRYNAGIFGGYCAEFQINF